jgi:hypothetical protein
MVELLDELADNLDAGRPDQAFELVERPLFRNFAGVVDDGDENGLLSFNPEFFAFGFGQVGAHLEGV